MLLVLDTFAKGREVIVARTQLVEIGGGFRIPEVLERSGAALVEVGTTNRVYLADFERALSPRTALLLRTHPSNYRIEGFTHDAGARDLAELGRRAGVPVVEDLGSGALVDLEQYGVAHERTVQEALEDGIGLVTFSGDKLLGGPQAGIIAGSARLVAPLLNNPLLRALRVGEVTLAALECDAGALSDGSFAEHLPSFECSPRRLTICVRVRARMSSRCPARRSSKASPTLAGRARAERVASLGVAIAVERPDRLAARLRAGRRRSSPVSTMGACCSTCARSRRRKTRRWYPDARAP